METRPLLRGDFTTPSLPKSPNRYGVLLLVALAIAAVDIGSALSYPANLAICESIICQELNRGDCKSSAVQGELALLFLVKDTMDQVPGLILGLFFGVAADRYGRRPILLMCLCGLFLQEAVIRAIFWWSELLPLRAIWASPLAQVLGGGPQIGTSIAYAMITDVFSPEDRYGSTFKRNLFADSDIARIDLLSFS